MNKRYILAEIVRTAGENGGVPLGREAFEKQTGIRQTDWYGRFWARWGDALKEAGFSPNSLNVAFTDEHLLLRYADFVLELGRIPTEGETRLKRRADPTFPSHGVYTRLGSKPDLINRLRDFCVSRPGYEMVVSLCESYADPTPFRRRRDSESPENVVMGFVYMTKVGRHYKIGKTNAAGRRERELAIQLPEKARTVHVIRTDDPAGIEAYWHGRFASKRGNGEWFALDAADVAAFKRRKFM